MGNISVKWHLNIKTGVFLLYFNFKIKMEKLADGLNNVCSHRVQHAVMLGILSYAERLVTIYQDSNLLL